MRSKAALETCRTVGHLQTAGAAERRKQKRRTGMVVGG